MLRKLNKLKSIIPEKSDINDYHLEMNRRQADRPDWLNDLLQLNETHSCMLLVMSRQSKSFVAEKQVPYVAMVSILRVKSEIEFCYSANRKQLRTKEIDIFIEFNSWMVRHDLVNIDAIYNHPTLKQFMDSIAEDDRQRRAS